MRKGRRDMSKHKEEKGYVLVTVAALLVVFLGFAALGIDVGVLYSSRTAAQSAADAAALAGAFSFVSNPFAPQPDTAYDHAMSTAVANRIMGTPVTEAEVSVNVDVGSRRVIVDIDRNESTYFARALGVTDADIGVRAVAEASAQAAGAFCAKPFFVPHTISSDPGLSPCEACDAGQVLISNGEVTNFARSKFGLPFTIKPQRPAGALEPGQFYAIQLGDSVGAADYRNNIATCSDQLLRCQTPYPVQTGNMVGPTVQGIADLLGASPDVYVDVGEYRRPDGTIGDTSQQLIIAPLWDECNYAGFCPSNELPDSGATVQIIVVGFASIFIEGIQGNDVRARLVSVSACGAGEDEGTGEGTGTGTGGADDFETGPFAVPLRLVRLPDNQG
jgi:Flp pilus assembly protein TadG